MTSPVKIIYFKGKDEKSFLDKKLSAFQIFETSNYTNFLELYISDTYTAIIITDEIFFSLNENEKRFLTEKISIHKIFITQNKDRIKFPDNFHIFTSDEKLEELFYNFNEQFSKFGGEESVNEIFKIIVNNSPNAIIVLLNGKVIIANTQSRNILRTESVNELSEKNIVDHFSEEHRDVIKNILSNVNELIFEGKKIETKWKTNNGELIDIEITFKTSLLKGNEIKLFYIKDISDFKKRQKVDDIVLEILQKSNTSISSNDLFQIIHSALENLMPVKNFFIALLNSENEEISFPYYVDEFDNKPSTRKLSNGFTEFILNIGESVVVNERKIEKLISDNVIQIIGTKPKVFLGVPLKINGKSIGVLAVQDYDNPEAYGKNEKEALEIVAFPISRVIERKITEDERKNYISELTKLNSTKDKLFSIISHDLRSPFNSILGFVEILKEEFDTLEKEEAEYYINLLHQSSNQVFQLVTNLLQFSRFQLGKINIEKVEFNIKSLVDEIYEVLQGNIIKKDLKFYVNGNEDLSIYADREMMHSVIQNLISNSIKFTEKGGKIEICFCENNGNIELKIADTGIGIPNNIKNNLFQLENVQSSPGTEKEPGTGLGLVLVKEFVEANGGSIYIESETNKGTTFKLIFPKKQNPN